MGRSLGLTAAVMVGSSCEHLMSKRWYCSPKPLWLLGAFLSFI